MLEGLNGEGEATVLVLWALVEEVRTLLRVKRGVAAGKPLAMLLRENRVWGPRERLIGPALSRVTEDALEQALAIAARLDRQVKGLSGHARGDWRNALPPDAWDGLFELAMTVAAPRATPGARGPAPAGPAGRAAGSSLRNAAPPAGRRP
jgi:DNA polymerase-3 subunit delta